MAPTTPITTYDVNEFRTRLNNLLAPLSSGIQTTGYKTTTPAVSKSYTPVPTPLMTPAPTQTKNFTPAPAPTKSPAPVQTPTAKTTTTSTPSSSYSGGSIVDYLRSVGQDSSYSSRATLAQQYGISNYTGTASQNTQLLNALRAGGGSKPTSTPTSTPNAPTLTPEQQAQADRDRIADEAGRAGLSVTEYQNLMNTPSKKEREDIAKELGITELEASVFRKPKKSTEDLYKDMYATAGLADVKSKIDALNKEIDRDREQLREAIGGIDENPFLVETSRVGRGKRVLDQAEQKINNKLSQVQRYQDAYNMGVDEINKSIIRIQADFTQNQEIDTAKLNYLLKKMEVQVSDLGNSKMTGSLSSYLKGRTSGKTPDVIGNSETGFYKYDATTGRFIQVIGESDKSKLEKEKLRVQIQNEKNGGGESGFKPTNEQKALVGRFVNSQTGKSAGATPEDYTKALSDPNFFWYLLQLANENGIY